MSKIGRKPIPLAGTVVTINGAQLVIKGQKAEFTHELPFCLEASMTDKVLVISVVEDTRKNRMVWGLHRALLANKIKGASVGFEKRINLVGLGYKGRLSGQKIIFSIGYSHKVEYTIPRDVTVDIDKKGQAILIKAVDKFVLGNVCDAICAIRRPEPYKGTGIMLEGQTIRRKAGKTKA